MPYDVFARLAGRAAVSLAMALTLLASATAQERGPVSEAPVVLHHVPTAPETTPAVPAPTPAAPPVRMVEPRPAPAAPLKEVVKELRSGPLLMHGNFCGIGNRPGKAPIDALDAACMRHDACTRTGKLPSCACNDRLRVEAAAIAQDPRAAPDELVAAAATASAMAVLVCKTGGRLEVPILPAPR